MQFYTRSKRPVTINIVSLIDILSILLIFFIVTTTFKKTRPAVEIELPESTTATEASDPNEPVIIYVTAEEEILIGETPVPMALLAERLRATIAQKPEAPFSLEADESISLSLFVKVMDAATEAGLEDLSLQTKGEEQSP
ncbi:MAG: biopolymer transporter ExbD [Verrucomicrobiota bacterium]